MGTTQVITADPSVPLAVIANPTTAYVTLTQHERVISEHIMQRLNEDDRLKLYTEEEFRKCAISITTQQVAETIIPALQREVAKVIDKRTHSAHERAKHLFAEPGEASLAEKITAALLDPWFTKETHDNIDPRNILSHVQKCLDEGRTINLAANMLPCKLPSPLKSRGELPDFSEISILCRLGEITGVVNALTHEAGRGDVKAVFNIAHDGTFFMDSLSYPEKIPMAYKKNIAWWIDSLGFSDRIASRQYTDLLNDPSVSEMKTRYVKSRQEALETLERALDPVFNPKDMQTTLERAIQRDPFPDATNAEGRFVPLLKSIMYSVGGFPLLSDYADKASKSYQNLYREMTRNIFGTFSDLSLADANAAIAAGPDRLMQMPERDTKEALRVYMVERVWKSTKEYMAVTAGHRNLEEDLLKNIIGLDVLRFTIHPKPGQIGLIPGEPADHTLAWHGSGVLRKSHSGLREGCEPRLQIEGEGGIPVLIDKEGGTAASPLTALADSGQPFFYITREAADSFGIGTRPGLVKRFGELLKRTQ